MSWDKARNAAQRLAKMLEQAEPGVAEWQIAIDNLQKEVKINVETARRSDAEAAKVAP